MDCGRGVPRRYAIGRYHGNRGGKDAMTAAGVIINLWSLTHNYSNGETAMFYVNYFIQKRYVMKTYSRKITVLTVDVKM